MAVFETGMWVLVPHPEEEYVAGRVTKAFKPGEAGTISLEDGSSFEVSVSASKDASLTDEVSLRSYDNMIKLNNLNEPLILHNLRKRFVQDNIYTSISSILVAVNPFKLLPMYTPEILDRYKDGGWRNQPPHIYSVADNAYHSMLTDETDQAVIISGESGAGKTETMKLVLQFLAEVSGRTTGKQKTEESLEQQILKSNPVMEAFGNAKTTRNNNSSRFGKWTEIVFNTTGSIVGGSIINYLLEKSRIPFQAEQERNYHIFYQLLAGGEMDPAFKARFKFRDPEEYHYLNQSGVTTVDTINDEQDWEEMNTAMDVLNMSSEEKDAIFQLLSGILHLGNLEYMPDPSGSEDDAAKIKNDDVLELAASQLEVDPKELAECLCFAKLKIAGSVTLKQYNLGAAATARDATSKALYGKLFDWLINKINLVLGGARIKSESKERLRIIGVLDIFGFESFQTNSFEQLCINFCNEKLQFHFNEHIFSLEQKEYESEGIDVSAIQFADNRPTLELLEAKSKGLFAMIDEEISVPRGSDTGFLSKAIKLHAKHPSFSKPKPKDFNADKVFIVRHYAGAVPYNVTDFLTKNKDALHEDITATICKSSRPFIASLMAAAAESTGTGRGKKKQPTLGFQFKRSLNSLMDTLNACSPHFVRCMKPNHKKKGGIFESSMMLAQLRYAGLLEVCRIRQIGYPVRKNFEDFLFRFRCLASKPVADHKELLDDLASQGLAKPLEWQIGHTKVFMRNQQQTDFEEAREKALVGVVARIQKLARRFIVRCRYVRWKEIIASIRKAISARTEEALETALTDSPELPLGGEHIGAVKEARALKERLEEERRVSALLTDAISERDVAALQAAVAEAKHIEYECEERTKAEELIAVVEKEMECIASLERVVSTRDETQLQALMAEAESLGQYVVDTDAYRQAVSLKKRLDDEEAARTALRAAIEARDYDQIATALDKMEQMGMEEDLMNEGQTLKGQLEAEAQAKKALTEAVAERKLDTLAAAVSHAKKISLDPGCSQLAEASALLQRLEAEDAITQKLASLAESEDLSALQAAVDEANAMSPPLSETVPSDETWLRASKRVETLKAWTEVRGQLKSAKKDGSYAALSAALSRAGELNLPDCSEMQDARKAMDKLGKVAKTLNAVMDAVRSGDLTAIEAAISEAESQKLGEEQAVADARKAVERYKQGDQLATELEGLIALAGSEGFDRKKFHELVQHGEECGLAQRHGEIYERAKSLDAQMGEVERIADSVKAAVKNRDEDALNELLVKAQERGLDRAVEVVEKGKQALVEEQDINAKLEAALEAKDTETMAQLVERATGIGIENSLVKKAQIQAGRQKELGEIKQKLRTAMDANDMSTLNDQLGRAMELGIEGDEVEAAKRMREAMAKDKELAQGLRAAMKTLTNKAAGRNGIEAADLAPLEAAMEDARDKGLSDESPFMKEAVALKERMEKILVIQVELQTALDGSSLRALKKALDKAEDAELNSQIVRKVRSRIRDMERERSKAAMGEEDLEDDVPALDDDEMRRARDEKLNKAMQPKFHFTKYPKVRNPDDFAKGLLVNKKKAKAQQLRWQQGVINKSLLDFAGKEESKIATRIHKALLGYCGDKTMSFPATLAQDILQKGLEMPELVDEIYMQVCKQLANNPRPESQIRAWQVLCMAVGTFPPSRDFENYLLNFILSHRDEPGAIGNYGRYCLRRLEGILNSGPSGFVPSVEEISAYKERPPILATIELVDGTPLTEDLPITPDLNVGKVLDICTHFMELQDPRMQCFGIFVEDIEEEEADAANNPLAADAAGEPALLVKRLPKTARPLQNENFMGDIVTVKVRQNQPFKFVFKRKIYLKNMDEPSEDPMFSRLVYLQAVDEVIKGNIPVDTEEEVATMVAQFMAVELGEEMPDTVDDFLHEDIMMMEYVPKPWRSKYSDEEWAERVLQNRDDALEIEPEQLQNDIVEQVKDHPLYGTCFFYVRKHKFPEHMDSFPDDLILAFNSEGLHFLDMNKETLSSFGYADVYRWGGSSTQFSLIIWNPVAQDTDDVSMFTSQAPDMAALILDYINAIMATTDL